VAAVVLVLIIIVLIVIAILVAGIVYVKRKKNSKAHVEFDPATFR
jgi:heme/copper-type cytochrome/quinol oxidase subunit 2